MIARPSEDPPLARLLAPALGADVLPVRVEEALHAIRTHLGMDVAFVSEFVGGRRVFRRVDSVAGGPVVVGGSDPLDESYCQRVLDGRLPELIHDAAVVPEAAALPVTAAIPVGAHLSVPVRLSDGQVYGTLCCFSFTPDHSLTERDVAMMRVFADLIGRRVEDELIIEQEREAVAARVRDVLRDGQLLTALQPILSVGGGGQPRPIGVEALSRFGDRTPDVWFAEAASVGLGTDLDIAAARSALRLLDELPRHLYLAVNVMPETVISGRLDEMLEGADRERVMLEITEHSMIASYDAVRTALDPLRRTGVRLAVDDAGAGFASFRHILSLRPDVIKLDMALTRDIDRDPARRALATAMISFARDTRSSVVAEGVESAGELVALERLGVTAAQGYFLGRPQLRPPVAPRRLKLVGGGD